MLRLKYTTKWLLLGAILAFWAAPASLFPQAFTEQEIKAQYIIKMQPFITVAGKPVRKICYYEKPGVSEKESVGQLIQKYLKNSSRGITVKWFKALGDFSECDIFFIPSSEEANIDNILSALRELNVLSISGTKNFVQRGGMIGFVVDSQNRVKMEANLKNIKDKNVTIQAKILELMARVIN